jgi:hypothetical protein
MHAHAPKSISMKPKTKQDKGDTQIIINQLELGVAPIRVVSVSPLLMNRMAEKARQELLLPKRKTSADKRSNLKHNPIEEYRSAAYRSSHPSATTALHLPSGSFTKAMASAALDIPGATKSQIQRLVRVKDLTVQVYGVPKLHMSIVRTLGMNKTPDIRTRPCFPKWAATFEVTYVMNLISSNNIVTLLQAAGFLSGVGDYRGEKGGQMGQFKVVDNEESEELFASIVANGGKEAQLEALENPEPYDAETAELYSWFEGELARR